VKKRLTQSQELLQQVQQRRQEVQIKAEKAPKNQSRDWETTFWDQPKNRTISARTTIILI